jgi:hypothetical protein
VFQLAQNVYDIPSEYLLLDDCEEIGFFELNSTANEQNINLWLGTQGVVTHMHMVS